MKTLHKGTVKTGTIEYTWSFDDAGDHEHPYILSVTVAGQSHSEGCNDDLSESEALSKADHLARELHAGM